MLKAREIWILNATGLVWNVLEYSHGLIKEIGRKKIKIIANKSFRLDNNFPNTEIKYLPLTKMNYATTFLFNNKVIIQTLKDKPLAVKIESKEIYQGYKANFELLWNRL